ncbi:hypothetical protein VNI00_012094 [Paramarasmius palmivorus]|uniref:Uncharacterized protein n=1 Tax=Paramarasmius palmivorus TaxID=297713 RepID=A0AAW0C7Z9_9AGAR
MEMNQLQLQKEKQSQGIGSMGHQVIVENFLHSQVQVARNKLLLEDPARSSFDHRYVPWASEDFPDPLAMISDICFPQRRRQFTR